MSPEYRFFVSTYPVNAEEADKIQTAIGMIKGVKAVLLNEVQVVPADNRQILDLYLDQLTSANAPPFVEGGWIRNQLPELTRYQLRDWVKHGLVEPGIPYSGRGRRRFTTEAAQKVGGIWYLIEQGFSPQAAAAIVELKPATAWRNPLPRLS